MPANSKLVLQPRTDWSH